MTTMPIHTPRKRLSNSNAFQIRIRWLIYVFLSINLLFILYVYNVASSSSVDQGRHQQELAVAALRGQTPAASDEFSQWLQDNPNTPGARLVKLLREHLHPHPNAEGERLQACHDKKYPLCFAGHAPYQKAIDGAPADMKDNMIYLEKTTQMPFAPDDYDVWKMRRFEKMSDGKRRVINNLGTEPACLALLLAGAAVGDFGVVVELGTYLGLSSKCMGMGLNSTNRDDAYFAFDLFGNDDYNYDKITKSMPWTLQVMPDFKKESSYLWLWRNATAEAYPTAQAYKGRINATTLYPKLWKKKPIALLSVDSAKTWASFRDQTAGIQRPYMLKKGALLILMDFLTIDTQIKLLYTGCLGQYLQPVYSSFCKGEQWIFVATQTFSSGMIGACMQDYLGDDQQEPSPEQYEEMLQRAQRHTDFMASLGAAAPVMVEERKCMMEHLTKGLKESTVHWKYLRVQPRSSRTFRVSPSCILYILLTLTMVRFHLRDDDGDDTSTTEDLIDAMTEYNERQNDYPAHSQFADHSLPADDNNNAPAFIVAYQRNGTPFLVPYTPPKQPRRILWWFWIMVLATLTQLVLWYGPPAPPSQNETWHEFFRREAGALVQSASALLSVIPHVSHWISKELHAEVTELLKSPPCPLEVPSDFVGLEESIIGQSRAVTVTTQALHAWKKDDKALILVLSGTVGVGKLRLAQHVAARTMCENAVVKIQGRDYSYRHDLVAQLQQHVVAGGSSIIIIQHPEDMAPLLLSKALEALASTPNLIILITTHIGSRNIHRHLKDEGSSSSSSLDWALRHELDTELGQGVSEYVTAVAPFVPLGPSELQYIFIHKVRSLNLDMTLELAQAWTSPQHVEYLEWTSHGRTILTLSSRGAKVLDGEIWQRLVSQVQRCIGSKSAHQLDWDEDEAVIRVCNEDMCEEVCRFELASY